MTFSRAKMLFVVMALALPVLSLGAAETKSAWSTSYKAAIEEAKASKKVVLADFTGSDWCGYCVKLHKDVFSTAEFNDWAAKSLVLLELDYPHAKAQSDEIKKQNKALKDKFKIQGFPTVIFLDGQGNELGRLVGYNGNKDHWMSEAKAIAAKAHKAD